MTKCDCQIYEHCPVCNPTFFEQKMKTLILNDEVEFDLSEQHGLIVRLRSRRFESSERMRVVMKEPISPSATDAVATLSPAETARLKEFLNDPECHRSWW